MREDLRIDSSGIGTFDPARCSFHVFLSFFLFFPKASHCFFFRSKSDSGEAPRRRHLRFPRDVCLDRKAETDSRSSPYKVFRGMPSVH